MGSGEEEMKVVMKVVMCCNVFFRETVHGCGGGPGVMEREEEGTGTGADITSKNGTVSHRHDYQHLKKISNY